MPFEVYLQKKLFQPVGMACTGFTITPETALSYEMDEKWLSEASSPSLLRRILGIGYQPEHRESAGQGELVDTRFRRNHHNSG